MKNGKNFINNTGQIHSSCKAVKSWLCSNVFIILASCITLIVLLAIFIASHEAYQKIAEPQRFIIAEQKRIEAEERERQEREERERQEREAREKAEAERIARQQKADATAKNLTSLNLPSKKLDVKIIYQYPEAPAGCEALALTNMINYYGYNLGKLDILKSYLKYSGSDFVNCFMGSPYSYSAGGASMCPAIKNAADLFIANNNAPLKAYDITGKNFEDLFSYIERGHPVQIWASIGMGGFHSTHAKRGIYTLYGGTHSVVLSGFDRATQTVYIADSIAGNVSYSISQVKNIYLKQACQALVLISQKELDLWGQGIDASWDNTIPPYVAQDDTEDIDQDNASNNGDEENINEE